MIGGHQITLAGVLYCVSYFLVTIRTFISSNPTAVNLKWFVRCLDKYGEAQPFFMLHPIPVSHLNSAFPIRFHPSYPKCLALYVVEEIFMVADYFVGYERI